MSRRSTTTRSRSPLVAFVVGAFLLGACSPSGASEPAAAAGAVTVLAADEAASMLERRDDVVVIDVRTPAEFGSGHVDGALLADVQRADFDAQVDALDRDTTYVLYCRSGNRSAVAAERMRAAGFTDLYDAGAFDDLARAGIPTA
jgi:phage shock protein E